MAARDPDLPEAHADHTGRLPTIGIEDPEFAAVLPEVEAHMATHGTDEEDS